MVNVSLSRDRRRTRIGSVVTCVVIVSCGPVFSIVRGQDTPIALRGVRVDVARLGRDQLTTATSFTSVDASVGEQIAVRTVATIDDVVVWIEAPSGARIDSDNIGASYSGTYLNYESDGRGLDAVGFLLGNSTGFHQWFEFPSLGPGSYTIHYEAPPGLVADVAVIVDLMTASTVGAALFTLGQTVALNSAAGVFAAVFDGSVSVLNATVFVTATSPAGVETSFSLADDAGDYDDAAGDGLYGGNFTPNEVGDYTVIATITGMRSTGVPFERTVSTTVTVIDNAAAVTDAIVDYGEDDNGNGLFERLVLEMQDVAIETSGSYIMHAALLTNQGKRLVAYGKQDLAVGTQTLRATVDAADIVATNENGPYTITDVSLTFLAADGAIPLDNRSLSQPTFAYLLSQFERPPIRLTGGFEDYGVDTGGAPLFDILRVELGVDIVEAGSYEYSVTLYDQCSTRLQHLTAAYQALGNQVGTLVLDFDGAAIGANGVDGPFEVRDLLVFGANASLVETAVGTTQVYAANEFEQFTGFADCNNNGVPDRCDIKDGTSVDCNLNNEPDECETDCNINGVADECDLVPSSLAFTPLTSFHTGGIPDSNPSSAALADFNSDGNLDVAVYAGGDSSIWVHYGNGDGTFDAGVAVASNASYKAIAAADLNGDTLPDLFARASFARSSPRLPMPPLVHTITETAAPGSNAMVQRRRVLCPHLAAGASLN